MQTRRGFPVAASSDQQAGIEDLKREPQRSAQTSATAFLMRTCQDMAPRTMRLRVRRSGPDTNAARRAAYEVEELDAPPALLVRGRHLAGGHPVSVRPFGSFR